MKIEINYKLKTKKERNLQQTKNKKQKQRKGQKNE
jgi:hypothetical protein